MSKPIDTPIAIRFPAESDWYALVLEHDADGKPVKLDDSLYKVVFIPVTAWGLVIDCDHIGLMLAMLGGGSSSNVKMHPLGPDGQRLMSVKGYMGLRWPGESAQEAVDRIEAPSKMAAADAAAAREKREKREAKLL
jgi:hypothetical protein